MSDSSRLATARYPPLRQARGTALNTIMEDTRETQFLRKDDIGSRPRPDGTLQQLRLKTAGLPAPPTSKLNRLRSPLSAGSISTCSDKEWQDQMQTFDDLYDATDEETELSDDCTSMASTRPTSLATPITRPSSTSTGSHKRYPSLTIPSSSIWPSIQGANKSSPVPPTPPPKIPVSPATLSMLPRSVPAIHAPPSLDGSLSSDQISNISTPATPDMHSLPETDWNAPGVHVHPDPEDNQNERFSHPDASSDVQSIEIPMEQPDEDWHRVLGNFPRIPTAAGDVNSTLSPAFLDGEIHEPTPLDGGLYLPEDALATLRHIPLGGTPDPWSETSERNDEMWQIRTPPARPRSSENQTPASDLSGYSFTTLSIPSPGGFFASLAPRARHTWSLPNGNNPPSSATAENFYNCPWSSHGGEIVEQVIECHEREDSDEQLTAVYGRAGPPTAIRIPTERVPRPFDHLDSPGSAGVDVVNEISRPTITYEYDEHYDDELRERAVASLDRTSVWLAAQASYLAALRETNPINKVDDQNDKTEATKEDSRRFSTESTLKKTVRFADLPTATSSGPSALASKHSIYWRGFQSVRRQSSPRDSFIQRNTRFDAVQSIRLGLVKLHINCLRGKYEIVLHKRPPYKGPFSKAPRNSIVASVLAEKADFLKLEKEKAVLAQLQQAMWAIDALKYLNGGSLITSPASRKLSKAVAPLGTPGSAGKRRVRVLDLGGHVACEWAWHLAYDYPNVKIYTVVTKQQTVNKGIKGPSNHRQVSVPHLWKLPFRDNQFDVISARSLHCLLKTEHPPGGDKNEYDLCLKECYRCLKPGGYLEFFMMDAEISRAGPYGSATSIEFAFNLSTRGYDATPTKSFLCRLRKGGFVEIKRAWIFLPMGVEPAKPQLPRETPEPSVSTEVHGYEAVHGPVGSTADVASVTGLLGGWMWEQWLLKLQMEMGREHETLLNGIGSVFDEGRKTGAGWTALSGWAMKPKRTKSVTSTLGQAV